MLKPRALQSGTGMPDTWMRRCMSELARRFDEHRNEETAKCRKAIRPSPAKKQTKRLRSPRLRARRRGSAVPCYSSKQLPIVVDDQAYETIQTLSNTPSASAYPVRTGLSISLNAKGSVRLQMLLLLRHHTNLGDAD